MPDNILVFYGSYRTTRIGMRMATFVINELRACGAAPGADRRPRDRTSDH